MATTRARTSTKRATIMAEPFSGPAPRPSDDRRVPPRKQEDAPAEDTIDDEADEDRRIDDEEELGGLADPEPDHRHGDHGHGRDESEEFRVGIEDPPDRGEAAHGKADRDAEQRAAHEPGEDALEADGDVGDERTVPEQRDGARDHRAGRREQRRLHEVHRRHVPEEEQAGETDRVAAVLAQPPHRGPSGRSRRRATSTSSRIIPYTRR